MSLDKPRRSCCPVACSLDLIGDRWTLLVIRDLFAGKTHFKDFAQSPERIATNTLADRLQRLHAQGLIDRRPQPPDTGHPAYHLTDRGRALFPVLQALADWGLEHLKDTQALIDVPPPS